LASKKYQNKSKSQDEVPDYFNETKSRQDEWALAGKKVDQKTEAKEE
jgi:hypothetical protein